MLTHGSLFSGIGGFDLAAQWMGWDNIFHCENNTFCQQILKHYWPNAKSYSDIKQTNFTVHAGTIDILTGGFPCQPYSLAGKRKGTEDSRHLWPQMLRAIREVKPRFIVAENVPGIINWDGGLVLEQVQAEMEHEGYTVQALVLPAAGMDAPHARHRVFFVAYTNSGGSLGHKTPPQGFITANRGPACGNPDGNGLRGPIAYTDKLNGNLSGFRTSEIPQQQAPGIFQNIDTDTNQQHEGGKPQRWENQAWPWRQPARAPETNWDNWPTQPPVYNGNDGFPSRLDNITFPKWRNESIRGGGNAVVPALAMQVFKAIEQFIKLTEI